MASTYHGRPISSGSSSSSAGFHYLNFDTTLTKVFVGGLAWETQSHTLHSYFQHFGEILEAVVISDKNSGRSKGYGFVSPPLFRPSYVCVLYSLLLLLLLLLLSSTKIMLQ